MNPPLIEPLAVNLTVNFNTETPHAMVPPSAPQEMEAGNSGCIYCLTKVVHPRLGRGESYACGYKPYRCEICNYSTMTKGNLAIHEQSDRHLNNVQEYDQQQKLQCVPKSNGQDTVNASIGTIQTPSNQSSLPSTSFFPQTYFAFLKAFTQKDVTCQMNDFSPDLLEVADYTLFCQICSVFGTDSVEELISHAEQNRIPTNLDLANQQLTTHTSGIWHCNICAYRSPLKANFQLHCKTEKHAQRLSLLLHMQGGKEEGLGAILPTNNLFLSSSPKTNLYCQLRCLPCGFFTCSVHKMRVHCQTPVHSFLAGIFGAAVRRRSQLRLSLATASEAGHVVNGARIIYACRRCEMTCTSLARLMQHFQSTDFHDPLAGYPSETEDVTVLWEFDNESGMRNHFAIMTEASQLFQAADIRESGSATSEAKGDSSVPTSSPLLVSTRWENTQMLSGRFGLRRYNSTVLNVSTDDEESRIRRHSAPPTINAGCSFSFNYGNKSCECDSDANVPTMNNDQLISPFNSVETMHIAADPLSSWLNCANLQNSELLQELVRLIDEQKQQTIVPRTCDGLFAWFGADNSFCSFIICWLKYQFPQMGGTTSDEFVAFVLELIAQQPNVSGRFLELRELQQRQAFNTCQQCSPSRPFLLPSSISLHFNIHHNEELPALIFEAVEKMENTVVEVVRALQTQQFQVSPMKRGRTRLSVNQLEVLRSNFCGSNQLTEAAIADICEKTGLKVKVVKHWFRNTLFKERQRFKESPSTLDVLQPSTNEVSVTEHSDEMRIMERSTKPYFQADQNPSRRQMDVISSKVNLPKRVVQVWFQNARSRERRMFIKHAPHQSQSPKPNLLLPPFPPPPWQPWEASAPAAPLSELKCMVSGANSTNALLDPTSVDKLQQIFNRIFSQMPPLGIIRLPSPAPGQPPVTSTPQQLPLQPSENYEMDSPLDLSTVSYRSNDHQSSALQNHSPQASSAASANETSTTRLQISNQRAKEKKLARATAICNETSLHQPRVDSQFLLEGNECKLCDVKIKRISEEDTAAVTEHIFSKVHIDRLFATICQGDSWPVEKRQHCLSESKHE
ncbi:Zinc finger protein 2 [Taenia crassiceps]|uniref:Zinc finger protein 2 n=1 Tax=Taenia crassiceps TaxID=6207 RepID=A0ABR4QE19_9CEST